MKTYYDTGNKNVRDIVLKKFDSHCAYCGCEITLRTMHIDHIVPLQRNSYGSRFGDNTIENYNPACMPCNISKASFDLETWRKELALKIMRIERDSSTFRNLKRFGLVAVIKNTVEFYFERSSNG